MDIKMIGIIAGASVAVVTVGMGIYKFCTRKSRACKEQQKQEATVTQTKDCPATAAI